MVQSDKNKDNASIMISKPFGNRFQHPDVFDTVPPFFLTAVFFCVFFLLLQIPRQKAGESRKGGAGGERSQLGDGRLLVLDSVVRHLTARSPETAQRRATVKDAASR